MGASAGLVAGDFGGRTPGIAQSYRSVPSGAVAPHSPIASAAHLSIASRAILHNRGELMEAVGLPPAKNYLYSDNDLILSAYAKWNESCADFMIGEFAFAIWDGRRQMLFCCRDQLGCQPIYYSHERNHFVFAGDIDTVIALSGSARKPNFQKLAGLAVDGQDFHEEETFHAGVHSIPAGSWRAIKSGQVQQNRYWQPRPDARVPKRPDDVFEALRDILFRSVECRLGQSGTPAVHLSGGLDSSSVVAIASRCLARKNRQLVAIAGVLPEETRDHFRDEREYIDEFRSWSNVHIEYVTARGRGPFDRLTDPTHFRRFFLRHPNSYLEDEFDTVALANGIREVLAGFGGEWGVTSWASRYYLELAANLRWPTLVRELRQLQRVRGISPVRMLGGQALDALSPARNFRPYMLFRREFLRGYQPRQMAVERCVRHQQHLAATLRRFLRRHERGQVITRTRRTYPLLDKRVLEFCLAVPADLYIQNGYHRCLIRKAMDGILPRRIQTRTTKIPFSPDYPARFRAQLGMAREFVISIGAKDPVRRIVDVEKLAILLKPEDPLAGRPMAAFEIPMTCYLINFLRQFAEFRP